MARAVRMCVWGVVLGHACWDLRGLPYVGEALASQELMPAPDILPCWVPDDQPINLSQHQECPWRVSPWSCKETTSCRGPACGLQRCDPVLGSLGQVSDTLHPLG